MDMAFLRRAERMLETRQPARIDHSVLIATIAAQQSAGAVERRQACRIEVRSAGQEEPLVELLLAGPGWRRAASVQRGCFSRAEAGRRFNGL
jgi:hypothetical protein